MNTQLNTMRMSCIPAWQSLSLTHCFSLLVSLQKRVDGIPMNLRRERVWKAASSLKRTIQIVRDTDGWDGHAPSLEDLLANGGS
jgi:hypothetical protein